MYIKRKVWFILCQDKPNLSFYVHEVYLPVASLTDLIKTQQVVLKGPMALKTFWLFIYLLDLLSEEITHVSFLK